MINKGAETLPNKDAQAYKQLAVILTTFRNFTMQETTKKDSNMQINYSKPILIIHKHLH